MDRLENFFEDVKKIREILEKREQGGAVQSCSELNNDIQNNTIVAEEPAQAVTVPAPEPATAIPTATESFTQEQIAKAMSNAQAAGKIDVIQNILTTFNANCLMAIDKSNYNQIAVMLREAGIQV